MHVSRLCFSSLQIAISTTPSNPALLLLVSTQQDRKGILGLTFFPLEQTSTSYMHFVFYTSICVTFGKLQFSEFSIIIALLHLSNPIYKKNIKSFFLLRHRGSSGGNRREGVD